jgi:hypothetical protein
MDFEEAFRVADTAVFAKAGKHLSDVEKLVLQGSWQGDTYEKIADNFGYSPKYLKQDVGPKLWSLLSKALDERVSKKNFRVALERRSHSAEVSLPQEQAQEETPSKNTDFVGREEAIAEPPPDYDMNKLVEKVRSQFRNKIQKQCETLCLLDNIFDNHWSVRLEQLCIDDVKVKDESDRFGSNQGSQTPVHWQELVLTKRKLMVLGKPGAGKTTLLQHIAIQCVEGKFRPELVPIFIKLKFFAEDARDARDADGLSLLNYIGQEYCDDSVSKQEVEDLLQHGRALILLDGLDEVPKQDTDEVLKQLRRFLNKFFNNQIIITCRKAAQQYLDNRFQGFMFVEVADFDKKQIETFAARWFEALPGNSRLHGEDQANQFIKRLNHPQNQRIKELAGTPLLLHLTCLIFQETNDFPSKQFELYRDALNLLITKWYKFNKGIQLNKNERDLLIKQLSQVAAITFEQGEVSFKLDRIQQIFEQSDFASEAWLKSIEAQHGLLVKQGRKNYSFSHQIFQEYLTAEAFATSSNPKDLESLVSHINDPRWREVILITAEIIGDKLLVLMDIEARKYINSSKLTELLSWADQVTAGTEGGVDCIKPAAKRAAAICLALVFRCLFSNIISNEIFPLQKDVFYLANKALCFTKLFDYKVDCSNGFGLFTKTLNSDWKSSALLNRNFVIEIEKLEIFKSVKFIWLIKEIDKLKTQIPNSNYFDVEIAFRKCILQTWLTALNLKRELINLSMEEIKSLGNYIEANHFILWCKQKQETVEVSPTWKGIEEQMLLVN